MPAAVVARLNDTVRKGLQTSALLKQLATESMESMDLDAPAFTQYVVDEIARWSPAVKLVNSRMESLFGYPRATLLGQHFSYLLSETQREQHHDKMKHYLQAPSSRHMADSQVLQARRRDGSLFPCRIGLSPLLVGNKPHVLASISELGSADDKTDKPEPA